MKRYLVMHLDFTCVEPHVHNACTIHAHTIGDVVDAAFNNGFDIDTSLDVRVLNDYLSIAMYDEDEYFLIVDMMDNVGVELLYDPNFTIHNISFYKEHFDDVQQVLNSEFVDDPEIDIVRIDQDTAFGSNGFLTYIFRQESTMDCV